MLSSGSVPWACGAGMMRAPAAFSAAQVAGLTDS